MASEIALEITGYERAVLNMRNDPAARAFVESEFLDDNLDAAANRFSESGDFSSILALMQRLNDRGALSVLDLGGGRGILSFALARKGHRVVLLEINSSTICGLGALSGRALPFAPVRGDFNGLPFKDGAFDMVICKQALHHSESLARVLAEAARVLKRDGGILAYKEHCLPIHGGKAAFLSGHIGVKYGARENAFKTLTYLTAFRKSGFRRIEAANLQTMEVLRSGYGMHGFRSRMVGLPMAGALLLRLLYFKYILSSLMFCRPGQTMNFIARKG